MAPSTVNDVIREVAMAAPKREWNRSHVTLSSTGSANAYVITYTTAPASYINGQRFSFRASFANTGSATANINGLGAKTINLHGASGLAALAGTEIQVAHHVTLEYDSTADVLVLISPSPVTSGSLGTIASQNANNVSITGGSITGITDIAVADGGTGRSTLAVHGVVVGNATTGVSVTTPGTAGQVLTSNGALADPTFQAVTSGAGVTYSNFVLLTSGTTWSVPAGVTQVLAVLQAGGGSGGDTSGSSQASGGGGAPGANVTALVAVSGSVSYAIGAAGLSGAGGNTTFGTVTAKGGPQGTSKGGSGTAAANSAPAISPLIPAAGVSIIAMALFAGTPGADTSNGGAGVASPFGVGGSAGNGGNGGAPGSGFGGGGGGANGNGNFGGNGRIGCIVIFY